MAGVWVFRNGVAKLVQNPMLEPIDGHDDELAAINCRRRKALVYLPTKEVISSYAHLEEKLLALGWLPYHHHHHHHSSSSILPHHRPPESCTCKNDDDDYGNHNHDLYNCHIPHYSSSSSSPSSSLLHGHPHPHPHPHHPHLNHPHHTCHHHPHHHQHLHHDHNETEEHFGHELVQFHRCFSSSLLISLPRDFSKFKTMHMYDIVLKNRQYFEVRDLVGN